MHLEPLGKEPTEKVDSFQAELHKLTLLRGCQIDKNGNNPQNV